MRCRNFILISAVWLSSQAAFGDQAFVKFGNGWTTQKNSEITLKNLPPTLSQDSLGLCFSYATTYVMNYENCRINKVADCSKLPDTEAFSPLDIARFGQMPDGDSEFESSYRGIPDGGPSLFTLDIAALHVGNSASEACHSLDKILSKMGGAHGHLDLAQEKAFKDLKKHYQEFKKVDQKCQTCIEDYFDKFRKAMCNEFDIPEDNVRLLKNFSEETYGKFFDRLFYPKECARAKNRAYFEGKGSMQSKGFPEKKSDLTGTKKQKYNKVLAKVKELLKAERAPMLSGICLDEKFSKDCKMSHVVVLTGIKRLCDPNGVCYDAIRVQSSWGEAWQKSMNGGWVSAEELLDSTGYDPDGMLSWLEPKAAEGKGP